MTAGFTSSRRQVLTASIGVATGLAGCAGGVADRAGNSSGQRTRIEGTREADSPPEFASQYDSVINAVSVGADPTGNDSITSILDAYAENDTLIYFPDGVYSVDADTFRNLSHFALVAADGAKPAIVPSGPVSELGRYFLTFFGVRDFRLEGFRFDFRSEGVGGRVQVIAIGDFVVRDIETVGTYPEDVTAFRFDVRVSDGVGLIDRLSANTTWQTNPSVTGLYVGHQHEGTLTFRDCHVSGFPDNGLYASAPGGAGGEIEGAGDGPVHVEGGSYRNNNVANVRLGSTGSTLRGASISVDRVPPHSEDDVNARGVRLRGQRDQVIENCDIRIGPEAGDGFGAIVFHHDNGRATVRNCRVTVDRDDIPAVNALEPDTQPPTGPIFEDVSFTGNAESGDTIVIKGRDRTTFRRCCIHQTGARRNGIRFVNSDGCTITNSTIDVPGTAVMRLNSTANLTDVTYDGACEA